MKKIVTTFLILASSVITQAHVLQGVWQARLNVINVTMQTNEWRFTETEAQYAQLIFDSAMNEEGFSDIGTYELIFEGAATTENIYNFSIANKNRIMTPLSQKYTNSFNRNKLCGVSNWAVNVPVDVTQTSCGVGSTPMFLSAEVKDDALRVALSNSASLKCLSPAERCDVLEDSSYIKSK